MHCLLQHCLYVCRIYTLLCTHSETRCHPDIHNDCSCTYAYALVCAVAATSYEAGSMLVQHANKQPCACIRMCVYKTPRMMTLINFSSDQLALHFLSTPIVSVSHTA